jgi:hypothetical protein
MNEKFSDKLERFCEAHGCEDCPLMQDCMNGLRVRMAEIEDIVEGWDLEFPEKSNKTNEPSK